MASKKECPLCKTENINLKSNYEKMSAFYECPVCGKFELFYLNNNVIDENKFASYMFYHCYSIEDVSEYRYNTMMTKEDCDKFKSEFENGNNVYGHPIYMDSQIVENWYPKTFSERINYILLYLAEHIKHIGQSYLMGRSAMLSLLFVDRYEFDGNKLSQTYGQFVERDKEKCNEELAYMLHCLKTSDLVTNSLDRSNETYNVTVTPLGYNRVDELQKNSAYGRNVLVAMEFGNETLPIRNAIRKGITDAGYIAIFIDEVQHNNFITPELLKYIRDSKFVVVDLTHPNNGAYFEEGYAMGLGKTVIQMCKSGTKLHFDIAQKNTIMWDNETEISEKLCNRIKATID